MKQKAKIISLLLCFGIILGVGTAVAYYNTKTLGFDDDTKIFSKDDEKITFFDFEIYYSDINEFLETADQYLPENPRIV